MQNLKGLISVNKNTGKRKPFKYIGDFKWQALRV